jgi:hypothetical protein
MIYWDDLLGRGRSHRTLRLAISGLRIERRSPNLEGLIPLLDQLRLSNDFRALVGFLVGPLFVRQSQYLKVGIIK